MRLCVDDRCLMLQMGHQQLFVQLRRSLLKQDSKVNPSSAC
jgi:hypothetical protein